MRFKKLLCVSVAAVMASTMLAGLTACGSKESFTVWCPEEAVSLTTTQINNFISEQEAAGEDFPYEVVVEAVGEGEAATNMLTDVTSGADIFFFAQDQLARLTQVGALSAVSSSLVDDVTERNDGGSVAAATVDGTLYAYPLTSDNGYFMYYDKSVLSETDILDQTTIIEKCEAAGKQIGFQLTNSGWYAASYFFATGCVSDWVTDSVGEFTNYNDNFNSDNGIIAVKGMAELIGSSAFVGSDAADASLFANGGAAVVVSGTWDYNTALSLLGENLGCAKLWSFTVDGTSYQLGSFSGNKLLGMKPQTDATKAAWAQLIANYLTGETCQTERFDELAWGPSNTNSQDSEAVQANPALAALAEQSEYATPQGQYPNAWWDASKAIGVNIQSYGKNSLTTDEAQEVLTTYEEAIYGILYPAFMGWVVVGTLENVSWSVSDETYTLTTDYSTYESYNSSYPYVGIWTIEVKVVDSDGYSGFRICQYNDWSAGDYDASGIGYSHLTSDSYENITQGDDNNCVVTGYAGTYRITLDTTGDTPTLKVELVSLG